MSKLDLFLRITPTLATLLIGVAALLVTYRQYTISKQKLRLDLYNKRYDLFLKLRMFVSDLAMGDNREPLEIQNKAGAFKRDTIECRFLFDANVAAYFDTVYKKATEWVNVQLEFRRPNLTDEQENILRERETVLRVWFFNQSDEMFTLFKKDLSIKTLQ